MVNERIFTGFEYWNPSVLSRFAEMLIVKENFIRLRLGKADDILYYNKPYLSTILYRFVV